MIRKNLVLSAYILFAGYNISYGTAQTPERIIFEGKENSLFSTPLKQLYKISDSLEIELPDFSSYFSESDSIIGINYGNWRGYVATWQIENDTLYLIKISDDSHEKGADLEQIFGNYFNDGKVAAFWYTGDLIIPKGDLVSYIHMGFMSRYEKEIVIEIEDGAVQEINEYSNDNDDPPRGFVRASTLNLTVDVPKSLKICYEPVSDTICFLNKKDGLYINGIVTNDLDRRLDKSDQRNFVYDKIDSCIAENDNKLAFGEIQFEKQRYGSVAWVDGISYDFSKRMRVLVMSNFGSRMIITIITSGKSREKFDKIAEVFSHSLIFMEYGN